jgi:lysophospholipase L1-like esterase
MGFFKNQMSIILFVSLSLNILVVILGTLFILKRGGWGYIYNKVFNKVEYHSYYLHKKSQFEILPKSESAIMFLGDSLTDEGEWVELLGNPNIKNRGVSSDTTELVFNRLDAVVESKPQKIFLMVGVNDLMNALKSVEQTLSDYKKILTEIQKKTPNTKVFIQSVLPGNNQIARYWVDNSKVLELNVKLKELAKDFSYEYIDVYSYLSDSENKLDPEYTADGLHLNGKGYLRWKNAVEKYVAD